jgi:hypothetical protein
MSANDGTADSRRQQMWRAEVSALPNGSHVNLFGHLECIIDLDAEVSRGALDLGMAEQQLNRPQVAGSAIDQRGFGSAQ